MPDRAPVGLLVALLGLRAQPVDALGLVVLGGEALDGGAGLQGVDQLAVKPGPALAGDGVVGGDLVLVAERQPGDDRDGQEGDPGDLRCQQEEQRHQDGQAGAQLQHVVGRGGEEGAQLADVVGEHPGDPGGPLAFQVPQFEVLHVLVRTAPPVVLDVLAELAPLEVRGVGEARDGGAGDGHQPCQAQELGGRGGQAEADQRRGPALDQDQCGPAEEGAERHLRDLAGDREGGGAVEPSAVRSDDLQQGVPLGHRSGQAPGRGGGSAPGPPQDGPGRRHHAAQRDQLPAERRPADQGDPGRHAAPDGQHGAYDGTAVGARCRSGGGADRHGTGDSGRTLHDQGDGPADDPADVRGTHPRIVQDEDPAGDRAGLRLGDPGDPPQGCGEDFGRPGPPEYRLDVPALTARNNRSQTHV